MKLSVALCTYNGERFLPEQLASIVNQSLLPDEMIICDDHSTDTTPEIIASFKNTSPFPVTVSVNPVNIGSTRNFESAFRLCTGDVIVCSDQDDVWKPEKLRTMSSLFTADPEVGYVFSNAELVDAGLHPLGVTLWDALRFSKSDCRTFLGGKQCEVLLKRNVVSGMTMAFRTTLRDLTLPFPKKILHDEWIATLASILGIKGAPIPGTLVLYRQHSNQQQGEYRNLREKVENSLATDPDAFARRASVYREMKERVLGRRTVLDAGQRMRMELLERKTAHFLRRRTIRSSSGWFKFRTILDECMHGNYHSFSEGWLSIGSDILVGKTGSVEPDNEKA
jgi:glycosyltransferase involved in cell wall biosynthesis